MGRAKLRMELIPKEKTRNTTFQKRKLGIIKKAKEFSILCDVHTVMIIFPPNSNEPEVWPENPELIKQTISFFKSKKGESGRKTYDLKDFFVDRQKKIEDELIKARKKNMEAKYATWFDEFNAYPVAQLRFLADQLEYKEKVVRAIIDSKQNNMKILMPSMLDLDDKKPMFQFGGLNLMNQQVMNQQVMNQQVMNQHVMSNLGQFQLMNQQVMNQRDLGWPNYGYNPMYDGGVIYDNVNQWAIPQPMVVQQVPDFVMQFHNAHAMNNNGGLGDYMIDGQRERMFLGN